MTENSSAPVDTTPVAAPAVTESAPITPNVAVPTTPDPVPVDAPVAAPVTPDLAPAPADPAKPQIEPSLLETFDPKAEGDPAAAPGTETPAPPEGLQPAFDYKYELPASITMDDVQRAEVHSALDTFRTNPAEGAQALLDLHAKKMQEFADSVANAQITAWNTTRQDWRTKIQADEQLGGAGFRTTMAAVARMRDLFVPEAHQQEFKDFLAATGAGDHPAFIRLLHNAARRFDEPSMPPPNPQPPPNNGGGKNQGRRALYTHPSSQK